MPPGQNLKCLLFSADNQITTLFWRSSLTEKAWVLNKCFLNFQDQTEMGNIFWMFHKPVCMFSRPVFPSYTSSKISKATYSTQLTGEMKWQFKVLGYKCLGKRGAAFFFPTVSHQIQFHTGCESKCKFRKYNNSYKVTKHT